MGVGLGEGLSGHQGEVRDVARLEGEGRVQVKCVCVWVVGAPFGEVQIDFEAANRWTKTPPLFGRGGGGRLWTHFFTGLRLAH